MIVDDYAFNCINFLICVSFLLLYSWIDSEPNCIRIFTISSGEMHARVIELDKPPANAYWKPLSFGPFWSYPTIEGACQDFVGLFFGFSLFFLILLVFLCSVFQLILVEISACYVSFWWWTECFCVSSKHAAMPRMVSWIWNVMHMEKKWYRISKLEISKTGSLFPG